MHGPASKPAGSTLTDKEWRNAWRAAKRRRDQAVSTMTRSLIDPRVAGRLCWIAEDQPWGTIVWSSDLNGATPTIDRIVIADPDGRRAARMASWSAASYVRRSVYRYVVFSSALPAPLKITSVLGCALGAGIGVVAAAPLDPLIPTAYDTIGLVTALAVTGGVTPRLVARWRDNHTRHLTAEQYNPEVLDAIARFGVAARERGDHVLLTELSSRLWRATVDLGYDPSRFYDYVTSMCKAHSLPTPDDLADPYKQQPVALRDAKRNAADTDGQDSPSDSERARLERIWGEAVDRHDRIRNEWMDHQTDIDKVLDLPTLTDVTEAPTAEFVERLGHAVDLATDTQPDDPLMIERYVAATRAAEIAWDRAKAHAERTYRSRFNPDEQERIGKIQRLMHKALRGSTSHERQAYYNRATDLLDTLVHPIRLPDHAITAVESAVRGELPEPSA